MRRLAAAIAFALCGLGTPGARAELSNSNPRDVCDALRDERLSTDGWRNVTGESFGCDSSLRFLGSGGAVLQNNLTFHAVGTSDAVAFVKLSLIVNDRGSASMAHQELLHAASKLSARVAGSDLSEELKDAIRTGKEASQTILSSRVRIARQPSENGYAVKVNID